MLIINKTKNKHMEQLIKKVLRKVPNKKKYNLDVEVIILDYDLDRVYLECCGNECILRMWDVRELKNENEIEVRWSFYFYTEGIDTPEELSYGYTKVITNKDDVTD